MENDELSVTVRQKNSTLKAYQQRITTLEIELVNAKGEIMLSRSDLSEPGDTDRKPQIKPQSQIGKLLSVFKSNKSKAKSPRAQTTKTTSQEETVEKTNKTN